MGQLNRQMERSDGSDTRERILAAAERLFAERGVAATSLRAVTAAAGVNLAAVHYHFGSKAGLLHSLIARSLAPVNQERLKRLDELEAALQPPSIEQLLEAFLQPALETLSQEANRSVSALIFSEPLEIRSPLIVEVFGEVAARFTRALAGILPELSPAEVLERFRFVVAVMVHVLSGHFEIPVLPAHDAPRGPRGLLQAMVHFLAAGLRAPALPERGGV